MQDTPQTPGLEHYVPRRWIDVSTLTKVARCPRLAFYQIGCGLRKVGLPLAMDYGSAIHKALPELVGKSLSDKPRALAKALTAFSSVWTVEHESQLDEKRNINRALASFNLFFDRHTGNNSIYRLLEPPKLSTVLTKPHVNDYELTVAVDIGLPVPLVGRVDALVEHRDTREIYGLEWKTTSQGGSWFLDCFELSPQLTCYDFCLRKLGVEAHYGRRFAGMLVESIYVSKIKEDVLLKPVAILPHHHEAFVQWARYHGALLLECERTGHFPQWFSGCSTYPSFGSPGFVCEYQRLCQVENWTPLKDLYRVEHWNPFEVKEQVSDAQ